MPEDNYDNTKRIPLCNGQQGRPLYSEENFKSSDAHHLLFLNHAFSAKMHDTANKAGLDILTEISNQLSLN